MAENEFTKGDTLPPGIEADPDLAAALEVARAELEWTS